jgi:feruloyl esterase
MGGSTGGQQALMEAQRFPDDYDGILAIAPASNRTHLHTYFLWNWRALNEVPGHSNLSPDQIAAVTRAAVRAGAGRDGGAPGDDFLTDPRMCRFDPSTLLAPEGGPIGRDRLSRAQVAALKKFYAGPVNPRTGERIYPPPPVGSESALLGLAAQEDSSTWPSAMFYPWRWVFGAEYDYTRFDFDRDLDRLDQRLAPLVNANSPDLAGFRKRGGKLMVFSGTADPVVPFQGVIEYYERVIRAQGGLEPTQAFFRLFIAPGMGHSIRGGPGLNDIGQGLGVDIPQDPAHDSLYALVHWVEDRIAPDQLIATAFKGADPANGIRFQRPVYPYPKFPHYRGGDVKAPDSYTGVIHERSDTLGSADRYLH